MLMAATSMATILNGDDNTDVMVAAMATADGTTIGGYSGRRRRYRGGYSGRRRRYRGIFGTLSGDMFGTLHNSNNGALTSLNLASNELGSEGAKHVAEAVKGHVSVAV